jgi:hypothetical protein
MLRPARAAVALAAVALVTGCTVSTGGAARPLDLLTVERPGHPPNGPGVGDPVALASEPGGAPVTYGGSAVVQACDVVTLDDLASLGVALLGGTANGLVTRDHLDGQGRAPVPVGPGNLVDEQNTCHYVLGPDGARGSIDVHVHQPGYTGEQALDDALRYDHRQVAELGPVQVFEPVRPMADFPVRRLRHKDVHVELTTSRLSATQQQTVLQTVADRLPGLAADPPGPPRFAYDSPTFPVDHVDACAISRADDVRALFGVEAGPSVEEGLSPGVGRMSFLGSDLEANYVDHMCRRGTPEGYFGGGSSVAVHTTTFDSDDGAAAQFEFLRFFYGGEDTSAPVADGSFLSRRRNQDTAVVRSGLAVIRIEPVSAGRIVPRDALLLVAAAIAARTPARGR